MTKNPSPRSSTSMGAKCGSQISRTVTPRSWPLEGTATDGRFEELRLMTWQAYRGRTCVVTGGAGFVGAALTKALLQRGARVSVVDDLSTGCRHNLPFGAILIPERARPRIKERLPNKIEKIFHLSCCNQELSQTDPWRAAGSNTLDTLNMLEIAQQHRAKFVLASSVSVYGTTCEEMFAEEDGIVELHTPYAVSKDGAESWAHLFMDEGLDATILRLSNVYGPGMLLDSPYCGLVGKAIRSAFRGTPMPFYGEACRTYTHIADVVMAFLIAGMGPTPEHTYNIAGDEVLDNKFILDKIGELAGQSVFTEDATPREFDKLSVRLISNLRAKRDGLLSLQPIKSDFGFGDMVLWAKGVYNPEGGLA